MYFHSFIAFGSTSFLRYNNNNNNNLTKSVMTPSEKEEVLGTVSCQGKEYSQGQMDLHLVISRKIRREYLVSMVKLGSPRTLRRGI